MKSKYIKFSLLTVFIPILLFSFSGCSACASAEWQDVYKAYTQEEGKFVYQSINATIEDFDKFINYKDKAFFLKINEEDYLERYGDHYTAVPIEYCRQGYYFVSDNIAILQESGFYNDVKEDTIITFIINDYFGWNNWSYPVFAVEINGKTYLDFETGKENVLNFIKKKIENPNAN